MTSRMKSVHRVKTSMADLIRGNIVALPNVHATYFRN
jgi:hypothetical protein